MNNSSVNYCTCMSKECFTLWAKIATMILLDSSLIFITFQLLNFSGVSCISNRSFYFRHVVFISYAKIDSFWSFLGMTLDIMGEEWEPPPPIRQLNWTVLLKIVKWLLNVTHRTKKAGGYSNNNDLKEPWYNSNLFKANVFGLLITKSMAIQSVLHL